MTCSSCHYSSSRETSQLPSGDACMIWNFELCISGPAIPDVRVLARSCWPYSDGAKKLRHPGITLEMKMLGMAISGGCHFVQSLIYAA